MKRIFAVLLFLLPAVAWGQMVSNAPPGCVLNATGCSVNGVLTITSPTDGTTQFATTDTPNAANHWTVTGAIAGNGPSFVPIGSDTNISGQFYAKGTGSLIFGNGSGVAAKTLDPGGVASTYLTFKPGLSGAPPVLGSSGNGIDVESGSNATSTTFTENGYTQAVIGNAVTPTSSIAWIRLFSGQTGNNYAQLNCDGTDPSGNTNCYFSARGNGSFSFVNSSGSLLNVLSSPTNTATGNMVIRAASSTTPVLAQAPSNNLFVGGNNGSVAALATTATTGFMGIPAMAGHPTGVPTATASGVAYLVYDTTDKELCAYNGATSAWNCSAAFAN